jgi:dipeptidyl aminopeptidase/acylaminoacyl peptidase
MDNTSMWGASFSPDGEKILVSSDETGVYNAYAIPVNGGEPIQLTQSTDDAISVIGYFPSDERFLYSSDQGGNERTHIYVQNPDGSAQDLTPGEKLKATFLSWSHDEQSFFFLTNERNPRCMDLYEMTLDGYQSILLYQNDDCLSVEAISPDRRLLALTEANSNHDSDIFLYDRETKKLTDLSPRDGEVSQNPQAFSPDGRSLYYVTNKGSEFSYLARYDIATGKRTTVLQPEGNVFMASLSRSGRYLVVVTMQGVRLGIQILDLDTLEPMEIPDLAGVNIRPSFARSVVFSHDGDRIAFYAWSGRSPGDLYVYEIGSTKARRLTRNLNYKMKEEHLVEPEIVSFASYDGLEIEGLLYRPHGASPEAQVPALVWIHGGPGGASVIGYFALMQYLVNHGYAVYAINNRGSIGYGKTFMAMDDRKHGEADLGDVVASKQMLIETGWIDPERIGVSGGSYGGYLTMAALTFHPEVFDVGVDLFGVTNWIRTLKNMPPWWGESTRAWAITELGNPATDAERLRRISPLFHADQITKPFIVLQGANDPRVLQVESDKIVAAARANGVTVEYIVFPDEGHGFRKKENKIRGYGAILDFLNRYLKGNTVVLGNQD